MKVITVFFFILPMFFEVSDATKCDCKHEYRRVGCFKDKRNDRTLPEMLTNERDQTSNYYHGHTIDWFKWSTYMPEMVCRCAGLAAKKGHRYFAIQFWGECWSGPATDKNDISKHGKGIDCYGPEYKRCKKSDENCVGSTAHNFVYETYPCDVNFEKIGCFSDRSRPRPQQGNDLILTARQKNTRAEFFGWIDWWNYDIFLRKFACKCAKKTAENGHSTFGMQFYGECWAGLKFEKRYYIKQGRSNACINKCYKRCRRSDPLCMGRGLTNAVFRITSPCQMKYNGLGCYQATKKDLNMEWKLLLNEVSPRGRRFRGNLLQFDDSWDEMFTKFLCRCAHAAKDAKYGHFAIRKKGQCWGGPKSGWKENMFEESTNCVKRKSETCDDNMKCAGRGDSISLFELAVE
ncbi:uncharacterized protein LOC114534800 [Dendronephthya gigantea]|uniref:uncharacterized protein LOC114534800 n=1 Tax=Dendronephthya gigantea TaxID=151771 RepID=UPI00106D1BCD|nr:uncharacterized protein LOC114534800 [Dendronephthya gigantea]XP_028412076.1 uncharacterized protein LOC114534800 [Dendronephthya gigantea]